MKVVWNVPNVLTLLRMIAAPLLAYLLMRRYFEYALYLFILAALTDALDGFIARHFQQYTAFGAALDPLADKLITLTCIVILTLQGLVPIWLTLALVVRDSVIVAGAFAYHHLFGEIEIRPTGLGKLHTSLAFALFILIMAQAAHLIAMANWLMAGFLLVLMSCLASLTQYIVLWARKAKRSSGE